MCDGRVSITIDYAKPDIAPDVQALLDRFAEMQIRAIREAIARMGR